MGLARAALRGLAYRGGLLARQHRRRNRDTLTVAMFHRVVQPGTPAAARADPVYALPAPLFAECLSFVHRHYTVIELPDLLGALEGGPPLPEHALLLTFDDGWADTLHVAAPLLRAAGMPATVFVAADALTAPEDGWWQEVALAAHRAGRLGQEPPLALLARLAALPEAARTAALAGLADPAEGRHMLRPGELPALAASRIGIGAHGAAHLPLPTLDAAADLARCRAALGDLPALSFPHGRYDTPSLAAARRAGFRVLFTSDPVLNAAPAGRPGALLGRISIQASEIARPDGRLDPARLSTWLFRRPIRRLG